MISLKKPFNRQEQCLSKMSTVDGDFPLKPLSRSEQYLDYICKNSRARYTGEYVDLAIPYTNNISIPATILAAVSSLAVSSGIVIKNNENIYDIGRLFYDYIQRSNDLTWDFVESTFLASYTLVNDIIHIDKSFTDIVKGFFDSTFNDNNGQIKFESIPVGSAPIHPNFIVMPLNSSVTFGNVKITFEYKKDEAEHRRGKLSCYVDDVLQISVLTNTLGLPATRIAFYDKGNNSYSLFYDSMNSSGFGSFSNLCSIVSSSLGVAAGSFPYTGGYDWGKTEDKKENDSVGLPIPSNLSSLVDLNSDDFWNNKNNLVGKSDILIPIIDNTSVSICEPYSFSNSNNENDKEDILPAPQSRIEKLLYAIATGNEDNIEEAKCRIEQYLHYILKNNSLDLTDNAD